IPSGESKVHIEVLSVLWEIGYRFLTARYCCLGIRYSEKDKNNGKTDKTEHEIGKRAKKPKPKAFTSLNRPPRLVKNQGLGFDASRTLLLLDPSSLGYK
ncbi:hypothetical protein Tco_1473682, partial [Tanacetum coccineum]